MSDPPPVVQGNGQDPSAPLVKANARAERIERGDIANYARRHKLQGRTSGTGIYWQLLRDVPGDTVRPAERVQVNYRVELLDGTICYASEPGHPESFVVDQDDVESGLHEGIQHLSPGDSAVLILPSYRAYGLIGDLNKVPMRSSLVYHIGLVSIHHGP